MSEDETYAIANAINAVAHGGAQRPGGLEYLAMVLGTEGDGSVASAIRDGLYQIALAIRDHGNAD